MPFEFPTAPAAGTEHSEFGTSYVYDGTVWNIKAGGEITDYVLKAGDTMVGPLVMDATGLQFTNSLGSSGSDLSKGISFATGEAFVDVLEDIGGWVQIAAVAVLLWLVLLPYFGVIRLAEVMGEGRLREIIWGRYESVHPDQAKR